MARIPQIQCRDSQVDLIHQERTALLYRCSAQQEGAARGAASEPGAGSTLLALLEHFLQAQNRIPISCRAHCFQLSLDKISRKF